MSDLRRQPSAVLASLDLDLQRRLVFVEGPLDRSFLTWLAGNDLDPNALVEEIDAVEIQSSGGAKGRLVALSRLLGGHERALCFADLDHDDLLGQTETSCILYTDLSDADWYTLNVAALDKVLVAGLGARRPRAADLLASAIDAATPIGVLRFVSRRDELGLPINDVAASSAARVRRGLLEFDFRRFRTAVLNRGGRPITETDLVSRLDGASAGFQGMDPARFVRGRDVMAMIAIVLRTKGVSTEDTPRLLRTAVDRTHALGHPQLAQVVGFIQRPSAQDRR